MLTTNLRKVGGSVMLAIPPAILDLLDLHVGESVALTVDSDRLIVATPSKPRYTLTDLLPPHAEVHDLTAEEREWLDAPSVSGELL